VLPGGFMMAAYGAIARRVAKCMKQRAYFDAAAGNASLLVGGAAADPAELACRDGAAAESVVLVAGEGVARRGSSSG